jgi:hypothetical protein
MPTFNFIRIKPNFDQSLINKFNDSVIKILDDDKFNRWNESVQDLISEFDQYVISVKSDDPGNCIAEFYKSQIDDKYKITQYYDIVPFDVKNNYYTIMLTNVLYNDSTYLQQINEESRKNNFNLIASNMTRFYNNSSAIFGDVFIIKMSKEYYHLLFEKEIEYSDKIYDNFNNFDLVETFTNLNQVKIYAKPMNKIMYHPRDILNKYIKENGYEIICDDIIKIKHQALEIYIKVTEPLPNGCDYVMSMSNSSDNKIKLYYCINIEQCDVLKIQQICSNV